jgi:YbbR domain-containing protein
MEDDIDAFVDLSRFNAEGSYRVPVQVRKGGTALGVEPLEISVDPLEISLELDRKISKYVPLTANIRGNLQSGYDLVSHTLTPTQVVVDGPMNLLGGISELYTDLIDLDGRNADFVVTVNILNRDPLLTIRGNGQTEFHGFVRKLVPVKNIEGLPITVVGLPEEFAARTDLKLGSARIEGTQADLDLFRPPALFLTVDCSGVTEEGTYTLPVQIQLPPELNLIKLDPQDITVTVGSKDGADQ